MQQWTRPWLAFRRKPAAAAAAGLLVRRDAACAEVFLPAAPPATVTSGAGAWVFGSWVSLGSSAQVLVPSYVHIVNYAQAVGLVDSSAELAYGAGYTPLDAMREMAPFFNPGVNTVWALPLSMMCRPIAVPANETIYARLADSSVTAYSVELFLLAWAGGLPAFETIPLAAVAGPGRWYPANASGAYIFLTSGGGWAYGASASVVDPAPNDMLVVGIELLGVIQYILNPATLFQLGYGPSGSETWCATVSEGRTWTTRWVWPPALVKAGERLAVRAAGAAAMSHFLRVKVYDL